MPRSCFYFTIALCNECVKQSLKLTKLSRLLACACVCFLLVLTTHDDKVHWFQRKSSRAISNPWIPWPHHFDSNVKIFIYSKEIVNFLSKKQQHQNCVVFLSTTSWKWIWHHTQAIREIDVAYRLVSTPNTYKRQWQPFSHNWFCVDHQFRVLWPFFVVALFLFGTTHESEYVCRRRRQDNFTMAHFL